MIDDDHDHQSAMKTVLESAGHDVLSAYSKDEGCEKFKAADPDLVILDIMMDKLTDGFFFLYEIKRDPNAKRVPVLAVSGISQKTGLPFSPTDDEDYFPADDYLEKPVKADELLAHVEALLRGECLSQNA